VTKYDRLKETRGGKEPFQEMDPFSENDAVESLFEAGRRIEEIAKEARDRKIGWEYDEVIELKLRPGLAPPYYVEIQNRSTLGFNPLKIERRLRIRLAAWDYPENPNDGFTFYDKEGNIFGNERGWKYQAAFRTESPGVLDLILFEG
jgi:hypothetical protein